MPAGDICSEISPAGTEASGTGNMKLMLNGAVIGAQGDGANIEIVQEAGEENNYVFGYSVDDLNALRPHYNPKAIYDYEPRVRRVVDSLIDGTFSDDNSGVFADLHRSLLFGNGWQKPDYYFVLQELLPYIDRKMDALNDYKDIRSFTRKCIANTASAGKFSSDRTIKQYAEEIWHIKPLPHHDGIKLW